MLSPLAPPFRARNFPGNAKHSCYPLLLVPSFDYSHGFFSFPMLFAVSDTVP